MEAAPQQGQTQKRKCLKGDERRAIYLFLCSKYDVSKKLPQGAVTEAAARFQVNTKQISAIWRIGRTRDEIDEALLLKALSPKKKQRCGRKRRVLNMDVIQALPVKKRRTVRALARNSNIPKSTLQDRIKDGSLQRHSNTIKPDLTRPNEIGRIKHVLSKIEPTTLDTQPTFIGFYENNCGSC